MLCVYTAGMLGRFMTLGIQHIEATHMLSLWMRHITMLWALIRCIVKTFCDKSCTCYICWLDSLWELLELADVCTNGCAGIYR